MINSFNQMRNGWFHMVLDVVCNMEMDEKSAKWKSEYKGKTYYFCAPMCKHKSSKEIQRDTSSPNRSDCLRGLHGEG